MSNIVINWQDVMSDETLWNVCRVLYAYISPENGEILYIGKADKCSVRERWNYSAKNKFWDWANEVRGLNAHSLIVGDLLLENGKKFSSQLLDDVESLLIFKLQPQGNEKSRKSRISRHGMKIVCQGDWDCVNKIFIDD